MKRKETQLLMEEWRKVLKEGLYDEDPELLEEGWKDKILAGLGALMITVGAQGAGNAETISRADAKAGIMQVLDDKTEEMSDEEIKQIKYVLNDDIDAASKALSQASKLCDEKSNFSAKDGITNLYADRLTDFVLKAYKKHKGSFDALNTAARELNGKFGETLSDYVKSHPRTTSDKNDMSGVKTSTVGNAKYKFLNDLAGLVNKEVNKKDFKIEFKNLVDNSDLTKQQQEVMMKIFYNNNNRIKLLKAISKEVRK